MPAILEWHCAAFRSKKSSMIILKTDSILYCCNGERVSYLLPKQVAGVRVPVTAFLFVQFGKPHRVCNAAVIDKIFAWLFFGSNQQHASIDAETTCYPTPLEIITHIKQTGLSNTVTPWSINASSTSASVADNHCSAREPYDLNTAERLIPCF